MERISPFERKIRDACRTALNNPKLRDDDIQEWSTSEEAVKNGLRAEKEVYLAVPSLGVHCAVLKTADKRPEVPNA